MCRYVRVWGSVLVLALGAVMTVGAQTSRPTVALLDFEFGTVQKWWSGNQDIGKGIADLIVDELVNDGSFRMIERKRLDAILAEQNFSNSERADRRDQQGARREVPDRRLDYEVRHRGQQQVGRRRRVRRRQVRRRKCRQVRR